MLNTDGLFHGLDIELLPLCDSFPVNMNSLCLLSCFDFELGENSLS